MATRTSKLFDEDISRADHARSREASTAIMALVAHARRFGAAP